MKDALPRTPTKRAALISSYIHIKRASILPTVATLQKLQILTSNEQKEMSAMGSSVIKDIKTALDHSKGQRIDDARKRLLDNMERDQLKRFKPVTDNMSIHRVHCVENGIISVKKIILESCDSCLNGNYSNCQNCHITGTERKITMTREDEPNRENNFEYEDETQIKDLVNRGL
ncbi:unnamed protein product [Mytilus coruscus]|uniref:Uncharacterized protein n=1 Tax=Mytilus coruscus TaxID=42192 RepID=A0A6J8DB98_MYTCO|nr:unnamed protein product [Mytilus coruscus]